MKTTKRKPKASKKPMMFKFGPETVADMDSVAKQFGLDSRAAAIRFALRATLVQKILGG